MCINSVAWCLPTHPTLSVNNTALYCCLHWDESSPLQGNSMETFLVNSLSTQGVQKGTAGKRKSQMSLPLLTRLLPREPRQTQILHVLRLRVAAHLLQRQNITNNKLLSCYFGFPVILLLSVFRWS